MKLLYLAIRCDRCNSRPRLRTTLHEIALHRSEPPEQMTHTYQCQCGEVYIIPVEAYLNAHEEAA